MHQYGVILFQNTTAAMRMEKALKAAGFTVQLIPTPREFSADCGIALRFFRPDHKKIEKIIREQQLPQAGIKHLCASP